MTSLPLLGVQLQRQLFPMLAEELGPLSALDEQFSALLALADVGRFARPYAWSQRQRRPATRARVADGAGLAGAVLAGAEGVALEEFAVPAPAAHGVDLRPGASLRLVAHVGVVPVWRHCGPGAGGQGGGGTLEGLGPAVVDKMDHLGNWARTRSRCFPSLEAESAKK